MKYPKFNTTRSISKGPDKKQRINDKKRIKIQKIYQNQLYQRQIGRNSNVTKNQADKIK